MANQIEVTKTVSGSYIIKEGDIPTAISRPYDAIGYGFNRGTFKINLLDLNGNIIGGSHRLPSEWIIGGVSGNSDFEAVANSLFNFGAVREGIPGEKGEIGNAGEKGEPGAQGTTGEKGDQGLQGLQGDTGTGTGGTDALPDYVEDSYKLINFFDKNSTVEDSTAYPNGNFTSSSGRPRSEYIDISNQVGLNMFSFGFWTMVAYDANKDPIGIFTNGGVILPNYHYIILNFLSDKRETAMFTVGVVPDEYVPYKKYLDIGDYPGLEIHDPKKWVGLGDSNTAGFGNSGISYFNYLEDIGEIKNNSRNSSYSGQRLRTMANVTTASHLEGAEGVFIMGGTNNPNVNDIGTFQDEATPDIRLPDAAYAVGDKIEAGNVFGSGTYNHIFECVTAGTTSSGHVSSVTWDLTDGNDTTDGTAVFRKIKVATHYGDLRRVVEKLYALDLKTRIVFFIPIPDGYAIDDPLVYDENPIKERHQATINFCEAMRIDYLDLTHLIPVNSYTYNEYMFDQLHLNDEGHRELAKIIIKKKALR